MTHCRKLAAVVLAVSVSACGGSSNGSTTTPTPTVIATPQPTLFEGTLDVGGSAFYSFTVTSTGDVDVMLASVTRTTSPGSESDIVLGIGVGQPAATDCTVTTSLLARPALQSPLVSNVTPGIYCVRVYDVGNLRSTVNFAIRIVHT
jgi:hypothetical protein